MAHTFIRQAEEKHRSRLRHLESTYRMFPDFIAEMRLRAEIVTNHFTNIT